MLRLKKVAVTGGLSSGKTQFCHYLEELGAKVVNADAIVHQLLSPSTTLGKAIIELLGTGVVEGEFFNHKAIAEKVFLNPKQLRKLEQLLHPPTFKEIQRQYEEENCKETGRAALFVAEIPLLMEAGGESNFDTTVVVTAPEQVCSKRYGNIEEYKRRMQRQMPPEDKVKRADYVIDNSGSLELLKLSAKKIFNKLTTA